MVKSVIDLFISPYGEINGEINDRVWQYPFCIRWRGGSVKWE